MSSDIDPEPTPLAGLRKGGCSKDGEFISFALLDQGNNEHKFSCPHEAIPELVTALEGLAELAWKQRGSPNIADVAEGTRMVARSRTATGIRVDAAREGIVLSLVCGALNYQVLLQPQDCKKIGEALRKAPVQRLKKFPPN